MPIYKKIPHKGARINVLGPKWRDELYKQIEWDRQLIQSV